MFKSTIKTEMESNEKNQIDQAEEEEEIAMTLEEKFLSASYAAMMAEMAREDYDYEDNEDDLSDEDEI